MGYVPNSINPNSIHNNDEIKTGGNIYIYILLNIIFIIIPSHSIPNSLSIPPHYYYLDGGGEGYADREGVAGIDRTIS